MAAKVMKSMKGATLDGREINIEYAEKKKGGEKKSVKRKKIKKRK